MYLTRRTEYSRLELYKDWWWACLLYYTYLDWCFSIFVSPDHQIFHRCIQHLQLPSSNTMWLTHPFLGLPSMHHLALVFSFIFLLFFWPNARPSDWQASWCQSLGRSLRPGELHILGLCLQGTRSMRKWFGKFGLQLKRHAEYYGWPLNNHGGSISWTPAVEAWGLNHWTTREDSALALYFVLGYSWLYILEYSWVSWTARRANKLS